MTDVEPPAQPYAPWVPRRHPTDTNPTDTDAGEGEVDEGLVARPVPAGLRRRDRKAWQRTEAARLAAVADSRRRSGAGLQARKVTGRRDLGRVGRREYSRANRGLMRTWWAQQRRTNADDRSAGALVLVIILGAVLLWRVVFTGDDPDTANATTPTAASTTTALPSPSPSVVATPIPTPGTDLTGSTTTAAGDPVVDPAGQAAADAVATWFTLVCPTTWTQNYGDARRAGRDLMTEQGWAAVDPANDVAGQQEWATAVAAKETTVCANVTATVSSNVSVASGTGVVYYTAQQVTTGTDGSVIRVTDTGGVVGVEQDPSGAWLVGPPVTAG